MSVRRVKTPSKKRAKKSPTEKVIQKEILAWLQDHGYLHWRQNSGNIFVPGRMIRLGYAGLPDIIVVLAPQGRIVGIEVKSARGKLRPAQVEFANKLISKGGEYVVVRSVSDTVEALKRIHEHAGL